MIILHTNLQRSARTGYDILDESGNLIFTMNTEQTSTDLIRIVRNNYGEEIGRCSFDRNKFFPIIEFYYEGVKVGTAKRSKSLKSHVPPVMDFEGVQVEMEYKPPLEIYVLLDGKNIMTIEKPTFSLSSNTIIINQPEQCGKLVVLAMGLMMLCN